MVNTVSPTQFPSSSILLCLKRRHFTLHQQLHARGFSFSVSKLKPLQLQLHHHHKNPYIKWKNRKGICRAELADESPFYAAIGACMLSSFLLPNANSTDEDADSAITSNDTRFAVMGIVSFIPYFNWLSWVFAWLDTGKRRYGIYSLVYLVPYLRSNLSLYSEESWLPIVSIIFCIIHVQLEVSIGNGDLQGFQLFRDATKNLSSWTRRKDVYKENRDGVSKEESKTEGRNLSSGEERSRNEMRQSGVPEKPKELHPQSNEDWDDDDDERKH